MGAMAQVYVDPFLAADSGDGLIGTPYGDLQYALDQESHDQTNGNQFNIKAGTDELITTSLSLSTYASGGAPGQDDPLVFRGYTSALNDGGKGSIDMQGNNNSIIAANDYVSWIDMELFGTGSAAVVNLGNHCGIFRCEIHEGTGAGILSGAKVMVVQCHLHDLETGINTGGSSEVSIFDNYLTNDGSTDMSQFINAFGNISNNIISMVGAANDDIGIRVTAAGSLVRGNSILNISGSAGTIIGIDVINAAQPATSILDNLVEGMVTGIRIDADARSSLMCGHNG